MEKSIRVNDKVWVYKRENGKLYMRLKDLETNEWLTEWILVGWNEMEGLLGGGLFSYLK